MAMLAERKRKQKWSLNPRGKLWAQDDNKFGQKMLEKMGWSQGKGLGPKENGMVEHIKVSYKNDSQGIGYKETDDQWTEHTSNFSALLSALSGNAQPKETEKKLCSLEEKSQKSKARVHYRKFTRGKDLSKYSEKDLANIFGKKSLKTKKNNVTAEDVPKNINNDSIVAENKQFSNGGLISEYFKMKLPHLRKQNEHQVVENNSVCKEDSSESESDLKNGFGFGFNTEKTKSTFVSYITNENGSEITPKHKNKKKRDFDDNTTTEQTPCKKQKSESNENVSDKKKKKNKKHISKEENGLLNPGFDLTNSPIKIDNNSMLNSAEEVPNQRNLDNTLEIASTRITEQKLKKKKKIIELTDDQDDEIIFTNIDLTKNSSSADINAQESSETLNSSDTLVDKSKKRKKKSKKVHQEVENSLSEYEAKITTEDPLELPRKLKKKKIKQDKENIGVQNPCFDNEGLQNGKDILNKEFEVKRKDKKAKKIKKHEEEIAGLDNPALNLSNSIEETYDLILNVVSTPMEIKQDISISEISRIKRTKTVSRRKSVTFCDVTRERIIPSKEEIENETLDESDIVEIEGKLNDSAELSHIQRFLQKRNKSKKLKKGVENDAFDSVKNNIEENAAIISKQIDAYEAEVENALNEAKLSKPLEIEDIMVGEVGDPDGDNEMLPDGSVKLKFKYANFRNRSINYLAALTGPKKSYSHLIKGDIVLEFNGANLHEIPGYAVNNNSYD